MCVPSPIKGTVSTVAPVLVSADPVLVSVAPVPVPEVVGISPVTGGRPAGVVPAAIAVASVGGKLFSPAGGGMPKNTGFFVEYFFLFVYKVDIVHIM